MGAVTRAMVVGVGVPVAACAAAVAVEVAIMDQLPDPVATHWAAAGPDGFSSPALVPWLTVLLAGLLPVAMGASAVVALRRGERGFTLRFLPGVAAGLSIFLGAVLAGSLLIQRGLDSAQDAPGVGPVMLVALAAGVAAGVLGVLAQSREADVRTSPPPAAAMPRAAHERAVWIGRAEMTAPAVAAIVSGVLVAAVAAVLTWVAGDAGVALGVTAVALLLAALAATFTVFHVRVDAAGLTVRSGARLVRMRVPASDVESAAATRVSGLAQYGGFGIRTIPGATAVVLRSGEALEVTRRSGRRFVVTIDDAATAASLLAAVAEDAHAAQD